jgi:Protein of unknown function (DUF2817)
MSVMDAFATSYQQARSKFLEAASDADAQCDAYVKPVLGLHGEVLAIDVVRLGPPHARRLLMVSSACHGVEGYAGSAAQIMSLRDRRLHQLLQERDVALLLLHALNPHGFSFSRRVTAQNVDLNRNCVDFSQPLPFNLAYATLHSLLLPPDWPPDHDNVRALATTINACGMRSFQEAITRGQYDYSDGIFYGGRAPTWSQRMFSSVLEKIPQSVDQVAWIDLHTGLGPRGVGECIFTGGGRDNSLSLARQWWGEVTLTEDESAVSAALTGQLGGLVHERLGKRLISSITLEFGTCAPMEVLQALRTDAWAHSTTKDAAQWQISSTRAMKDAFFIDSQDWKTAVLEQSMAAFLAAVDGLANQPVAVP